MFSICWISNGVLESVTTPKFRRAILIADALQATGMRNVRVFCNSKLI